MYFVRTSKKVIQYLQTGNVEGLKYVGIVGGILVCSIALYRFFVRATHPVAYQNTYASLKAKYLERYVRLDNNSVERLGTGKLVGIITSGINSRVHVLGTIGFCVRGIVSAGISLFLLRTQSAYVFYYAICVLGVTACIAMYKEPYVTNIRRKISDLASEYTRYLVRVLMSKFEILSTGKFDREEQRLYNIRDEFIDLRRKENTVYFMILDFPGFLIDCTKFIIPLLAAGIFGHVTFALSDLAAMFLLISVIDNAITSLISLYHQTAVRMQDVTKVRDTFDGIPLIQGYETGKKFVFKKGDIVFDKVSFAYDSVGTKQRKETHGPDILHNFSLHIMGGKKTAFVGSSGSGKSTMIKLIAGYLHVTEGHMRVDGQSLQDVSLKSYYKHIGYLTQEPNVFDGTIYDNLVYAIDVSAYTKKVLDEKIAQALQKSKCEFIYELPQGIYTEIGEKGIRLSGGQRQRLAIAKVFLKDPEIVLLDEPTSALDSFAEQDITEAMSNLFTGRTVIIIAHRLQTVKSADDIIVLEKGEIIERGTHDELVKTGGTYAKMLELQSGF